METSMSKDSTVLDRRGFLAGIIAACAAPAIVRSGLIMPIKPALVVPAHEWTSVSSGITITEEALNEHFYEVFGRDAFGNPISERVSSNPDILVISRKQFQIIEKVVLRASAYMSPPPHTKHSVEQTESLAELEDSSPRNRRS